MGAVSRMVIKQAIKYYLTEVQLVLPEAWGDKIIYLLNAL